MKLEGMDSDIIYKYIDFDTGINNILVCKSLKFTNPNEFNDPFDCDEELISLNITEKFLSDFINRNQPNKNRDEKRRLLREMLKGEKRFISIFNAELQKQKDQFRVSCFSKTEKEILMWSHYANKHRGICIGFQKSGFSRNPDSIPTEVIYLDEFRPIDYESGNLEAFKGWLTTKSDKWSYEEEVRLFNYKKKEIISFEQELVKEIIFGCKVEESEITKTIQNLKIKGYSQSEFYKMVKVKNCFKLNKEKINSYT